MTPTKSEEMNSRLIRTMGTKVVRHLEKPKPLNPKIPSARHSTTDVPGRLVVNILEEVMGIVENLASLIVNKTYSEVLPHTNFLATKLKVFGIQLEEMYKDQLDRAFIAFRDASVDENLVLPARLNLLEMVELRAMQWQVKSNAFNHYYSSKSNKAVGQSQAINEVTESVSLNCSHLAPGEVIKPSGKYPCPTKQQGKNYCKDEVIIRNSDSGKVMGIKGRRVHMIEELSETVISFQRVNPGAKERLVQITGPTEDKIILARNLMEDTIKRNASPVREVVDRDYAVGSSSSLNSSASDDNTGKCDNSDSGNFFTDSSSESLGYRHTIQIGNTNLYLLSDDFDLISEANLLLDEHFNGTIKLKGVNKTSRDASVQCNESDAPHQSNSVKFKNHFYSQDKVEKKNITVSSPPLSPLPSSVKEGPRKIYSRSFLLNCSSSPAAKARPKHWSVISTEFASIVKQMPVLFDSSVYMKKWKELEICSFVVNPETALSDSE